MVRAPAHSLWLLTLLGLSVGMLGLEPRGASADAPRVAPEQRLPSTPEWRTLYDAGSAAFDAGRLDEALTAFTRAHDRGGPAALLYDIALTLDRLSRTSDAIAAYHRYVDAVPEASNRDVVEARLEQLEPHGGVAAVAPSAPIMSLVAPEPPTGTASSDMLYTAHGAAPLEDHWETQGPEWVASWVMLGLTAATSVAGVIVWYDGQGRFDALRELCESPSGCSATDIADSPAHVSEDASNALLGVSIGLGALTILAFIVEGVVTGSRLRFVRADRSPGPRFTLGPTGLGGSF